jgi:amino-acid N-acetyltransferase
MNALAPGSPAGALERARRSDLVGIHCLLNQHSLPSADVTEDSLDQFFVYRDEIGVAGIVALERYEDVALLRSLVVADRCGGCGLGRRLVAAAEELAQELHVPHIYLLTTTAESYFESLGFRTISRENAPPLIKQCSQFKTLCPSTAVLMVKP